MADDHKLPFNSANRLCKVIAELRNHGMSMGGTPSRNQLFEKLLSLDSGLQPHQRQRYVLSFINDANKEIDRVEHDLEIARVPTKLYTPTIKWLRSVFSAESISAAVEPKGHFPQDNLQFVGWMSFATPGDQDEMDAGALSEIADGIAKLIDEIRAAGFSPSLAAFLIDKLNDALLAIKSYQITGLEPLYWKFRNIATEVQVREQEINSETANSPEKAQAWEKFVKIWNGTHVQIQQVSNTITSVSAAAGAVTVLLAYTGVIP